MMLIEKVRKQIQKDQLLLPKAKVIVGVSGGSDSVALLDILYNEGYECVVAHCNFNLRGEESFRDEYFVEQLSVKYNLKYVSTHFDTRKHVEAQSISVEMAARELRYAWFEKIRAEYRAEAIAVAHHQDDSVETVLMNLIRGTGIRGLSGIRVKNGKIIRPLLSVSHQDLLDYLQEKGLNYVEDTSNTEDVYTRNKIRLQVIPLLETINPSVKQAISRTANNLFQIEEIYGSYMDTIKSTLYYGNRISIAELEKQEAAKTILFEILNPYGFNPATIENVYESIGAQSGKIFYSDAYRVVRDRAFFIIEENISPEQEIFIINEADTCIEEPVTLRISELKKNNFTLDKNPNTLSLDKAKIKFPLRLRHWRHGDCFVPFGMKGKQKLSDYFSDHKFSLMEKEDTWLICSGEDIVWIVGKRSDDRFRITDETEEIIQIELIN